MSLEEKGSELDQWNTALPISDEVIVMRNFNGKGSCTLVMCVK